MQLEPRRQLESVWDNFIHRGLEPAELRADVARSWLRARDLYRIDPCIHVPREVMSADTLTERRLRDEAFRIARPILADYADRLCLSDHALAHFDGEGWLLSIAGDPTIVDALEKIHFSPGSNWAESSAGTNGPGTALAIKQPLEVFSAEHFVEAWQPWSCAAAPVMCPASANPVAVVDITGPWQVRRRQALLIVKVIARAIEERLRAVYGVRSEVIRHALRQAGEHGDALIAVDLNGRLLAMNDRATRSGLALPGGELPPDLQALAGGSAIVHTVPTGVVPLVRPDGSTLLLAPVQYEGEAIGAILRIPSMRSASRRAHVSGLVTRYDRGAILGESPATHRAIALAMRAAATDLTVVLSGETGVGKELFAHAIHAASTRAAGPFVAVNCGAIPVELVDAELLGYEAGSFTGARREGRAGRCEDADGGTLFLDEVTELPPAAQTALLRVLQERQVVRVGGGMPREVDLRVIAATNRPLLDEVKRGRFRADLYYRLNVMAIPIPPLRDRGGDVVLVAEAFLAEACAAVHRAPLRFAADALARLRAHRWPGNIRELRNVILRAAATAGDAGITASDLLLDGDDAPDGDAAPLAADMRPRAHMPDKLTLESVLQRCDWNLAAAARSLGASRMALYRWMARHGIARTR